MTAAQAATGRRFLKSTRHTMEVDFVAFLHALRKLRRQGRKRAKARCRSAHRGEGELRYRYAIGQGE